MNKIINTYFLLIYFLISSLSNLYSDAQFKHITEEDGLSFNKVQCILKDSRGFMWFGTEIGLNRYDGKSIKIYKHNPDDSTSIEHQGPSIQYRVSSIQSPLVLIVEDNSDVISYIRSFLDQDYRIITAINGKEGWEIAVDKYPDLIISDVMMPEMDGFELCQKIKSDIHTSHIPVILLTAKADMASKLEGLEFGADDYISKPFEARELQARVKNLIEQRNTLREKFTRMIDIKPVEIATTSTDEKFVKRLLDVFENHVAESDFSTEDFAREIGMSRMHLNRKLNALTNQSTHEFIRILRLKRAAQLLKQTAGSVSEIAYMVGFNNTSHFAKAFRKILGQSSSVFSENSKKPLQ